jgi:hypothetical protein
MSETEGFEIQAVGAHGMEAVLYLVHKPCNLNVFPIETDTQDFEYATSEAYNHLTECPVILKSEKCWAEFPVTRWICDNQPLSRYEHKYSDRRLYACTEHAPLLSSSWVEDQG